MSIGRPTSEHALGAVVVGGGPACLMAAEVLARRGAQVTVFERMPSVGRKLLLAGRGGLNLTHSEPIDRMLGRYGPAAPRLEAALRAFDNDALRAWVAELGQAPFVGSSGRVFPLDFRATPLLRAWLARLASLGVTIETGWSFDGWDEAHRLRFRRRSGSATRLVTATATVLALGGASWPRTGSDGHWVAPLRAAGIPVEPLRAANCGVCVAWSPAFVERFAGQPLKNIGVDAGGESALGEALITAGGLEGGAIYRVVPALRSALANGGAATLVVDLKPGDSVDRLAERLQARRPGDALSTVLRRQGGLTPTGVGLLREAGGRVPLDSATLASRCKAVSLAVVGLEPIDRAISVAGGVDFDAVDPSLMLGSRPSIFVAGEMLDWEAPTGGYLLQGCFSTGVAAGNGAARWLGLSEDARPSG